MAISPCLLTMTLDCLDCLTVNDVNVGRCGFPQVMGSRTHLALDGWWTHGFHPQALERAALTQHRWLTCWISVQATFCRSHPFPDLRLGNPTPQSTPCCGFWMRDFHDCESSYCMARLDDLYEPTGPEKNHPLAGLMGKSTFQTLAF